MPPEAFLAHAHELDDELAARHAAAAKDGRVLRFLARLDGDGKARVGLRAVPLEHPAAACAAPTTSSPSPRHRYHARPLVIQGPGAGAEVTAQALLGDILALV